MGKTPLGRIKQYLPARFISRLTPADYLINMPKTAQTDIFLIEAAIAYTGGGDSR